MATNTDNQGERMTSANIEAPNKTTSGIQVIARAAQILRALEGETDGLSLGDLAGRVGLARSTVQRIVSSLIDEDFLMPASSQARVKIGPELVRLGMTANLDIAPIAKPFMVELSEQLNETVDLSILRGNSAVFVEQVAGSHRLAAISEVGTVFPLHSTANGKALLAASSREKRSELLSDTLTEDTFNTQTNRDQLLSQIETVLESSVAYDMEEHTLGICAIASAFFDGAGQPYSLSVPVPKQRFELNHERIEKALLKTRELIVEKLGGSVPSA